MTRVTRVDKILIQALSKTRVIHALLRFLWGCFEAASAVGLLIQ